jgi:hypothetical protein
MARGLFGGVRRLVRAVFPELARPRALCDSSSTAATSYCSVYVERRDERDGPRVGDFFTHEGTPVSYPATRRVLRC